MASKVHLIAYQPINNEERGLYRRVMAEALSPALWKQKQCTLQNILETFESCSLLHLHSIKDLEQKGKNQQPIQAASEILGAAEVLLPSQSGSVFFPPCGGGPGIEAPSH